MIGQVSVVGSCVYFNMEGERMEVSERLADEPRVEEESSTSAVDEEDESLESQPWLHQDESNEISMHQRVLWQSKTIIKGRLKSQFSSKSHVDRKHPAHAQFQLDIQSWSSGRKRRMPDSSTSGSSQPPQPRRARQPSVFKSSACGVKQSVVDRQIVDLFVHNMIPLRVVESPSFVCLIKMLNPSKTSMSHHTLGRRILNNHEELEEYLIRLLKNIPWIGTTADCWSVHNKSYLGMTAHWLDPETRTRRHAVLACSQIKGHLTFDVLARAMIDTHQKFNLQEKVTRTTTDNGKNFVKAFVQFGAETELLPDICRAAVDSEEEVKAVDPEAGYVHDVEYISVDAVLDEPSGLGLKLPAHLKCAAHTFNLVASVDAKKALESASFESAYRTSMSKAQGLWKLQSCSKVAKHKMFHALMKRLVVPSSTRWNSIYDSVLVLNKLLEKDRVTIHRLMKRLKLQTFSKSDVCFLSEWAQVMSSVAKALEKIQGEDQAYLGSLLPTVAATMMRLRGAKLKPLLYCSPLLDALLAGITERFGLLLEDQECQLAAAFHPKFRLFWLEQFNNSQVSRVTEAMESVVQTALGAISDEGSHSLSNEEDEEEDFFNIITRPNESRSEGSLKSKAQSLVQTWLETSSKDVMTDAAFLGERVLIDLFVKYNTAIPSSAAVEHLFSIGKDTLRAERAGLSDSNLEMLMFLKGNKHHIEAMSRAQLE